MFLSMSHSPSLITSLPVFLASPIVLIHRDCFHWSLINIPLQVYSVSLRTRLHVHGYFEKRRHFPTFVPFFYTQMENSPLKTILSKNSDQRFWKTLVASLHVNWEKLCLGQPTSQYAPQLHIFIWDSDLLMLAWASRYTSSSIVNEDFSENWQMCTMLFSKSVRLKW